MNITAIQNLSNLLARFKSGDTGQSIEQIYRGRGNTERGEGNQERGERIKQFLDRARERRSRRRGGGEEDQPVSVDPIVEEESPPSSTTPTESQPPSSTAPVGSGGGDLSIDDLAELYVKQYEEGSGVTLTEEAFEQKKADVAAFYEGFQNGKERLDKVVFANDQETVA